jgi:hypothetical protein
MLKLNIKINTLTKNKENVFVICCLIKIKHLNHKKNKYIFFFIFKDEKKIIFLIKIDIM